MIKKILAGIAIIASFNSFSQKAMKQDMGVNLAGLVVKNQPTVNPSLFYRYSIGNYQLRLQLSLNGNLNSKSREGTNNQSSFGGFVIDSAINFEPGNRC